MEMGEQQPTRPTTTTSSKLHLSGQELTSFPAELLDCSAYTSSLQVLDLSCNQLAALPASLAHLSSLHTLDLSDNLLNSDALAHVVLPASLQTLILNGNRLAEFPLAQLVAQCPGLTHLSLGGNKITTLPSEGLDRLESLVHLHLGGNLLTVLPNGLLFPANLRVLYLGGNLLTELPWSIGLLGQLRVLSVQDNQLRELPATMVQLVNLEVLNLHRNRLTMLPVEVIALRKLRQLSVRQNPLLTNFAANYHHHLPTLKELAGRVVKKSKIDYAAMTTVPEGVKEFLDGSRRCLGCNGAYFGSNCVSHVEFVDLCGSYKVPFIQYICSEKCQDDAHPKTSSSNNSGVDNITKLARLRKVLLDKYAPAMSSSLEVIAEELALQEEEGNDLV